MSDYVKTIEAAYRLDLAEDARLRFVADSARPWIDRGFGVLSAAYDMSDPARQEVIEATTVGAAHSRANEALELTARSPSALVQKTYLAPAPFVRVSEAIAGDAVLERFVREEWPQGITDFFGMKGMSPEGRGVLVGAWIQREKALAAGTVARC
jgi:hypothetical protein